jgi:DNA sulfur modification protein DndC
MANSEIKKKPSAFDEHGFRKSVENLLDEIRELYLCDQIPWVVGYSGGKDSTAALQLVWLALVGLEPARLTKPVHVISTDTLVENPIVAAWVNESLKSMQSSARQLNLPIHSHRLTPDVADTFWVSLIGKGYPAPRPKFRWCTERLKIRPANAFIQKMVRENGETILVLGTRKAESQVRARVMDKLEQKRIRNRLSPNVSLPNSLVFSPIEEWSNDDVWLFLMQVENPWGYSNKDLLNMYQGANPDGECPLVVDTSTPSCGDSRFGCWVCTLVDKDKSMQAMIQNDEEKEWMLPLLELRNELDLRDDRELRDFRRLSGVVQLFNEGNVPGPYTQKSREHWLRRVLQVQRWIRNEGPAYMKNLELITLPELQEIRRIWVIDKHELEDLVPPIYVEEVGHPYPGEPLYDGAMFGKEELELLKEICGEDSLHYELTRELLDVADRYRAMSRRAGLYEALEKAFSKSYFENAEDAIARAKRRRNVIANAATIENTDCEEIGNFIDQTGQPVI